MPGSEGRTAVRVEVKEGRSGVGTKVNQRQGWQERKGEKEASKEQSREGWS